MSRDMPDVHSVLVARQRIEPYVKRTRLVRSNALSDLISGDVLLKLETDQPSGSFKVRGAGNAMLAQLETAPVTGIATASTGNHARAVAHMGQQLALGVKAFVSRHVSDGRVRALEAMGVDVDRSSEHQAAAISAAQAFALESGYGFVPPFDHPDVISGQGTIGLELVDDLDRFDAVVVPVSGGGLVSGVGLAVKALRPGASVIGVCADRAPAMFRSLHEGRPVTVPEVPTVADSLMGDLGTDNRFTFAVAGQVIDEITTVSDEDIIAAMTSLRVDDRLDVEGAAAASAAHLRRNAAAFDGQTVVLLVTGNGD